MDLEKKYYKKYKVSDLWRKRHPVWLKKTGKRCSLTGLPLRKTYKWKGKRILYLGYNIHHMKYKDGYMGQEVLGKDVLPLNPLVHSVIAHRVFGGGLKAGSQPWGKYPNIAQELLHMWMKVKVKSPIGYGLILIGYIAWLRIW